MSLPWLQTISGNELGFFVEGVFWAFMFAFWTIAAFCLKLAACRVLPGERFCQKPKTGGEWLLLVLMIVGLPGFVYQAAFYTPWCYRLWQSDERNHKQYPPFWDGVHDAFFERYPSKDWSFWQSQVGWQTGYFVLGAQASLWLMRAPRLVVGEGVTKMEMMLGP